MRQHGDLLTPTLAGHRPRTWDRRLPWRLESQVFVGFFGGPLALALIAVVNGERLRMPRDRLVLMAAIGLVGTIVATVAAALVGGTAPRLLVQLAGVLTYGPLFLLQRSPDRVHSTFSPHADPDDDYGSLWLPGLGAVLAGGLLTAVLVAVLEGAT